MLQWRTVGEGGVGLRIKSPKKPSNQFFLCMKKTKVKKCRFNLPITSIFPFEFVTFLFKTKIHPSNDNHAVFRSAIANKNAYLTNHNLSINITWLLYLSSIKCYRIIGIKIPCTHNEFSFAVWEKYTSNKWKYYRLYKSSEPNVNELGQWWKMKKRLSFVSFKKLINCLTTKNISKMFIRMVKIIWWYDI